MKSYNMERTNLVLSFLMFKAMRILVLIEVFNVPEAKSIALDDLNDIISSL